MVVIKALLCLSCLILGHTSLAQIKGYVDTTDGSKIRGWACDQNVNESIRVHIYLNGPAGRGGTFFKSLPTNRSSENAIHNICKTPGSTTHRFHLTLSKSERLAHKGKKIFVHGLSKKHPNIQLNNSGKYAITAPDISIKGYVDSTQSTEDGLRVQGWACQNTFSQSTRVHVYSKQSRTFLGSYPANHTRGAAVGKACSSSINRHGFNFVIPNSKLRAVKGETLQVHGIRLEGNVPNRVLNKSESFTLPERLYYRLSDLDKSNPTDLVINGDSVRINKSIDLRHIKIRNGGILRCGSTDSRTYTITTAGIEVMGAGSMLLCGWNSQRFQGTLHIRLKKGAPIGRSEAGIMAMSGGRIVLHGKNVGTKWTTLNGHAHAGATKIRLQSVVNWKVGDTIAIASSSYNMWQTEPRTITAIDSDRKGVTLNTPLNHFHRGYGYSSGGKWINLKAEVVNLSRNITIRPAGNSSTLDASKIGGHIMVMMGGQAHIRAVQLNRMGQMGRMGRYPFHWHKAGNVAPQNQYFMDNAIVNSYQRCVTVHGTNGARVQNNVCYNHFGHGYFLEDGNETYNKFYYNVGMLSKRVPLDRTLLISDHRSTQRTRFDSPATFWISNPKNEFVGNRAAGSQGSGFWNAFVQFLKCETTGKKMCRVVNASKDANVRPARERTLRFDGNVAHSTNVGFTWDGAPVGAKVGNPRNDEDRQLDSSHYHYDANGPMPVFNGLTAYKNIYSGIYYRGNKSIFNNYRSADNGVHLFIAYSQEFNDAMIVGDTGQSQAEKNFQLSKTAWPYGHSIGMATYDGPTVLRRVHFAGFPSAKTYARKGSVTKEVTPVPIHLFGGASHYEHQLIDITFAGTPYYRVKFDDSVGIGWHDAVNHVRVRDVTGSIYGRRGELIVPRTAILDDPSCRVLHGGRAQALGCMYDMGTIHHGWSDVFPGEEKNRLDLSYHRRGGPGADANFPGRPEGDNSLNNKAGVILNKGYRYQFLYAMDIIRNPGMVLEAKTRNRRSPVLSFPGNRNCSVSGATRLGSRNQLNNYTGTSNVFYRDSNNTVHARLITRNQIAQTRTYRSPAFKLLCP